MQRDIQSGITYHVYNRGNLKMPLFKARDDYEYFLKSLSKYKNLLNMQIFAFCIMPNHFHILIKEPLHEAPLKLSFISRYMSRTLTSYSKYFSLKYNHSGYVFQGRFKSRAVNSYSYSQRIIKYIHMNPVNDGLVTYKSDWPYSSAFKGRKLLLCDKFG
jgi:putative transposase